MENRCPHFQLRGAMHAIEKILARAAGREKVVTGEIVNCRVDLAGVNDIYLQTIRSFYEMGGKKVDDPARSLFFWTIMPRPRRSNRRIIRNRCGSSAATRVSKAF